MSIFGELGRTTIVDSITPSIGATCEQIGVYGSLVTNPVSLIAFEGGPVTIGTTAVELTFTDTTRSIQIQADHDNTGSIWVGDSTVTSTGANALVRLMAGESISVDFNDGTTALYAVSDVAAQKIYKMALT